MLEFMSSSSPIARKSHRCEACGGEIKPGEQYIRESGKWEGAFFTRAWCQSCNRVMQFYFTHLAVEQEFDYDDVLYDLSEHFCSKCDHGSNREDDCEESIWHCPIIAKGILEEGR